MCRHRNIVTDIENAGSGPNKKRAEDQMTARFCLPILLCQLLDGNETDLLDYFLTVGADDEVDKLLHHAAWLAIGIEKGRPSVWIAFPQDAFLGRRGSINWNYLDAGGLGISQADVAHAIRVLADFLCDLLVAGELLRIRGVVALFHCQLLKL